MREGGCLGPLCNPFRIPLSGPVMRGHAYKSSMKVAVLRNKRMLPGFILGMGGRPHRTDRSI